MFSFENANMFVENNKTVVVPAWPYHSKNNQRSKLPRKNMPRSRSYPGELFRRSEEEELGGFSRGVRGMVFSRLSLNLRP